MRTATRLLPLPMALAIALVGCGQRGPVEPGDTSEWWEVPPERQIPAELWPAVEQVVQANNQFALDLYTQLMSEEGNLFISPYSMATALHMTYAGAETQTETEMADVLHISADEAQWHRACGALLRSLDRGSAAGGYELCLANRLWGQEGFAFLEPFVEITREDYGAELGMLDFLDQTEESRLAINQWATDKTMGNVLELLLPGDVTPLTTLVLTNAIYFKGTWLTQFDPEQTCDGPFHVDGGGTVPVPMMQLTAEVDFAALATLKVLILPYAGEDLSMVLLLPATGEGLAGLEALLTVENLQSWLSSTSRDTIEVAIPRFSVTSRFELNGALSDLGMPSAFNPYLADFSGILPASVTPLWIHKAIHKAYVEVTEEGTEAAGASAVVLLRGDAHRFVADHPFLFLIYDHVTGSILFVGRVSDPSA